METSQDFQELSNRLNQLIDQQQKDKQQMKALMLSTSKNKLSRPINWEMLNVIVSVIGVFYFLTRTVFFKGMPLMLWTGAIAFVLWVIQAGYSWVGYRRLKALHIGEEPVKNTIEKIIGLLRHYYIQKRIYIAFAPLTIGVSLPIPMLEFRKVDLSQVTSQAMLFWGIILFLAWILAIWISLRFYNQHFEAPLIAAKDNLKDLEE